MKIKKISLLNIETQNTPMNRHFPDLPPTNWNSIWNLENVNMWLKIEYYRRCDKVSFYNRKLWIPIRRRLESIYGCAKPCTITNQRGQARIVNEDTNQAHASPKNMWELINLYRQSNPNENFTLGIRRRERQLHILSKLPVLSKLRAKSATFSQILVIHLLRNLRTLNHLWNN